MRIGTNITALRGHNHLNKVNELKAKSMEKLSSGKRINSASDDAAGLAISEKMNAQIRGLKQAARNCQDGQSMVQTVEGVLNEVTDILQRIRELATQAANDSYNSTERQKIQVEVGELTTELDRIAEVTKFNNKPLLDGTAKDITLQVGANSGETLVLNFNAVDSTSIGLNGLTFGDHQEASEAIEKVDTALNNLMTERSTIGSVINRLDYTYSNINTMIENLTAAESRVSDVDMAEEVMNMTKFGILSNAANSMLAQAMQAPQSILQLLQQ